MLVGLRGIRRSPSMLGRHRLLRLLNGPGGASLPFARLRRCSFTPQIGLPEQLFRLLLGGCSVGQGKDCTRVRVVQGWVCYGWVNGASSPQVYSSLCVLFDGWIPPRRRWVLSGFASG